jgi:hypothetical protein
LGDGTIGANYLVSLFNSPFLFCGYPSGTFIGRKLVNWNLEYQFPVYRSYSGWGTAPLFSRTWEGAVFFDGVSVDGAALHSDKNYYRRDLSHFAVSTGIEARWNTTLAYNLPITAIFGAYFGFDGDIGNNIMPFVGLAVSDLSGVDKTRYSRH